MAFGSTLIERSDFEQEASKFLETQGCQALIVMGLELSKSKDGTEVMERDLGVYPNSSQTTQTLVQKLPSKSELQLQPKPCLLPSATIFKQGDPSYSRKRVLPIIQDIFGQK